MGTPAAPAPLPGGREIFEVRFHGRGGQGVVIASVVLAEAAFLEGRGVQAFPFFGVERRGAPVVAHTRIGSGEIRLACDVEQPDALIITDPSLVGTVAQGSLQALRPGGIALLNSTHRPEVLGLTKPSQGTRIVSFDASSLARQHGLGSAASPIVNTVVLGAFAKLTGLVKWPSLRQAIEEKVPVKREANVAAAQAAFESVGEVAS